MWPVTYSGVGGQPWGGWSGWIVSMFLLLGRVAWPDGFDIPPAGECLAGRLGFPHAGEGGLAGRLGYPLVGEGGLAGWFGDSLVGEGGYPLAGEGGLSPRRLQAKMMVQHRQQAHHLRMRLQAKMLVQAKMRLQARIRHP